ncbi:hypothetical protein [Oricola nitratireducens]|uniref:hypothetical protein n=1 Tax=Oricola nitratireducens TaxID=2775868 RepID=UPI001FF06DEF|nr:hypothetical protein [Oricola nitratireducens]
MHIAVVLFMHLHDVGQVMQHEAMQNIFEQRPHRQAAQEKRYPRFPSIGTGIHDACRAENRDQHWVSEKVAVVANSREKHSLRPDCQFTSKCGAVRGSPSRRQKWRNDVTLGSDRELETVGRP